MRCPVCYSELYALEEINSFQHPQNECGLDDGIDIIVDEVKQGLFRELCGTPSNPKYSAIGLLKPVSVHIKLLRKIYSYVSYKYLSIKYYLIR